MPGRRPPEMLVVVLGLFGHAAFYAGFGRGLLPVWLRVAGHLAVALPLLWACPAEVAGIPTGIPAGTPRPLRRRLGLAAIALAALVYLGLTLASLLLVVRGVRMHGLALVLVLESVGSAAAGVSLSQAVRLLLAREPPPDPVFQAPWAGAYRTRPFVPPPPAPEPSPAFSAKRGPRRWEYVGYAALSLGFTAAGLLMAWLPRRSGDRFWGLFDAIFFATCAWAFCEQAASGTDADAVLPARAERRMMAGVQVAGLLLVALPIFVGGVAGSHEALVAVFGAGLAAAGAWARRRAARRAGTTEGGG